MTEDRRMVRWRKAVRRFFFDGDDTIAAIFLLLLALSTPVAVVVARHSDAAREDVLKVSGGVLLLFGAYSASRTLALNRLDQRTGRIMQATEQLRSDFPAMRAGGLWTLVEISISSKSRHEKRQRNVINEVLIAAERDAGAQIDREDLQRARASIAAECLQTRNAAANTDSSPEERDLASDHEISSPPGGDSVG